MYGGGRGGRGGRRLTLNWRSCQRRNFRPQTSLEEYSEQSRSPKASKMDLQMIIGCFIFSKKSKMRFYSYLLHFRPLLTSKSELKMASKSFKNQFKKKTLEIVVQILFFFRQKQNLSKNGPKRFQKQVAPNGGILDMGPPWIPDCSQIDPRISE